MTDFVQDDFCKRMEEQEGYDLVRRLNSGVYIGVNRLLYTYALVVGIDEVGYTHRYCYEKGPDCVLAWGAWDGVGDPPGPWIKVKGERGGDRLNPELFPKAT